MHHFGGLGWGSGLGYGPNTRSPGRHVNNISRIKRKTDFLLCENKGTDQLCSNCKADQRLCFRISDSTKPLLLISKISSLTVKAGLCRTGSETQNLRLLFSHAKAHKFNTFLAKSNRFVIILHKIVQIYVNKSLVFTIAFEDLKDIKHFKKIELSIVEQIFANS